MKINEAIKRIYDTEFKKSVVCIFLILITCFAILISTLHILERDIAVPYSFNGGDVLSEIANFAFAEETGTWIESERTGAPFGMYSNTQNTYTDNIGNITKVVLVKLLGDKFVAFNVYYLLLFPEIAIIAFLVMRSLKISHIMSYLGSITYAFLPAIFLRGQGHLVVSCYQFVPFGILLCYWVFSDDKFMNWGKGFWKYRRNILALVMILSIGSNGMGYYPIFSCFLIVVTGVSCLVKNKRIFEFIKSIKLCAGIAGVFFLNCMPYILSRFSDTYTDSIVRNAEGAEIYGLKMMQLLLPISGHGIESLQEIITRYNTHAPLVNENRNAYLGLIGVFGLLVLLVVLFTKAYDKRLVLFSELNIFAILLGTIGGFGSVISYTFFNMIRSYNRISVFIAFLAIASTCILCDKILYHKAVKESQIKKIACTICAVCIFAGALWEQCDGVGGQARSIESIRNTEQVVKELESYFDEVENKMGDGAMIYCLPYHHFPEGDSDHNMGNSELYVPYLFTDTMKWSFGSLYGTTGDRWDYRISQLSTDYMLEQLSICGFDGVYVNGNAYDIEELNLLLVELRENLDVEPIWDNGVNYVFSMNKYNEFIAENFTDDEILKFKNGSLGISYKMGTGFSDTESNSTGTHWNWCDKSGEVELYNSMDEVIDLYLVFTPSIGYPEQYNLYIEYNGNMYTYPVSNEAQKVSVPIEAVIGKSVVKFSTDAPQISAPSDPRALYFRLFDLEITLQDFISVYDREVRFNCSYTDGFYGAESLDENSWRWCDSSGVITISSNRDCDVVFSFTPLTNSDKEYTLYVKYLDDIYEYPLSKSSEPIDLNMSVPEGNSEIIFSTNAPQVDAPQDTRTMYFRLYNSSFKVVEAEEEETVYIAA